MNESKKIEGLLHINIYVFLLLLLGEQIAATWIVKHVGIVESQKFMYNYSETVYILPRLS